MIIIKVAVEFSTAKDIKNFTEIVKTVSEDVWLIGKDENGQNWNISAKSLLCSLIMSTNLQRYRKHTAHKVDWNTIWCVCERDIYSLIRNYVRN